MSPQPHRQQHEELQQAALIVELSREPSTDQFTCSLPDWNFMRDLGQTFGWHPVGTTYLPQQGQRARHNPIKHDYQPGDTQDRKRIEAADSAQWVTALEVAKRSPFISGMLRTHVKLCGASGTHTEQSLHLHLQNFIEFARRSGFTIALRHRQ